ncbi:hypothetical protein [Cupriavidus gilardii]|uniref:hypothetical protein n=1 Tax=Cupriavidus gilardii TaxID=82541 RepID=UPI002B2B8C10|nr:hypothetical protein QWJ31_19690 [Cupriavidus gilardii]
MAYELKEGQGSLFVNDRKDKDSHPDYRGQVKINGQEFWLSAWIKTGARGDWISISAQPKDEQRRPQAKPLPGREAQGDGMDDCPF